MILSTLEAGKEDGADAEFALLSALRIFVVFDTKNRQMTAS